MISAFVPPSANCIACAALDVVSDRKTEVPRDLERMLFGLARRGEQVETQF